uniref:Uncharacterized protein n=1 Tax=uncultured Desulfobacterium sp. TaxID=201089 RepID=E1YHR9_9BACT|nr:unknown protein [uncultured Desulfobacterium sp.]
MRINIVPFVGCRRFFYFPDQNLTGYWILSIWHYPDIEIKTD